MRDSIAATKVQLLFHEGTIVVSNWPENVVVPEFLQYDERVNAYRMLAMHYRSLYAYLLQVGATVDDLARQYNQCEFQLYDVPAPYRHQEEAIAAWCRQGRCGVVVLPTGAGKSYVAQLAIYNASRSTLVVVPTLDLLDQWAVTLRKVCRQEIGMIGGGCYDIQEITVTTYDSAAIHIPRLGNRFGLIVFDEVHHLPGDLYRVSAQMCMAPFRLGLTATVERADGKHQDIYHLVGSCVYSQSIKELSGDILAPYETTVIEVGMTNSDAASYNNARQIYLDFLRHHNISMRYKSGWGKFLATSSQSSEGREALKAYQEQKRIALVHSNKLHALYDIITQESQEKILVFTNDNSSVYNISETLLCPSITHETSLKERRDILDKFKEGDYRCLVTSKVLNEGVDVPDASVAIILSGSSSVREHVQRLGRILRKGRHGKKARLYELVTCESTETYVSDRRRQHDAYE